MPTWGLLWKKETLDSNSFAKQISRPWKCPGSDTLDSIMYEQTVPKFYEKFYDAAFLIALSFWPDSGEALITAKLQIMNVKQKKKNKRIQCRNG